MTPDDGREVVEIVRSILEAEKPPHELAQDVLTALEASGWKIAAPVGEVSRVLAPGAVENLEASTGDLPKQGSGPQHDLRDADILAKVLAIVADECDRQKEASVAAGDSADKYRYNTALHALWVVSDKIRGLALDDKGHVATESPPPLQPSLIRPTATQLREFIRAEHGVTPEMQERDRELGFAYWITPIADHTVVIRRALSQTDTAEEGTGSPSAPHPARTA